MKKRFIAFGLTVLLISACGASALRSQDSVFAPAAEMPLPGMPESEAMFDAAGRPATDLSVKMAGEPQSIERLVIRNANLTLVVEDPAGSAATISRLADEMGGFVVNSNVYQSTFEGGVRATQASITIRVPAERLNEALERIKADAVEVRSENISGQDVTQEYTDLQARLRNLEAAEEELREIMGSLTKAEDVLRVYEQLRQVREQIEITKGRIQYYEQSARLSAITVDLLPDEVARPLQIGRWKPEGTAKDALEALIRALQVLAQVGIWFVIFVLPILALLSIPFWVLRAIFLRRRRRKQATEPNKAPPA